MKSKQRLLAVVYAIVAFAVLTLAVAGAGKPGSGAPRGEAVVLGNLDSSNPTYRITGDGKGDDDLSQPLPNTVYRDGDGGISSIIWPGTGDYVQTLVQTKGERFLYFDLREPMPSFPSLDPFTESKGFNVRAILSVGLGSTVTRAVGFSISNGEIRMGNLYSPELPDSEYGSDSVIVTRSADGEWEVYNTPGNDRAALLKVVKGKLEFVGLYHVPFRMKLRKLPL